MREYPKEYGEKFLDRARRFMEIADSFKEKYPEEASFIAIQAIINANDALTVYCIQERASKDHREAIKLHKMSASKIGGGKVGVLQEALDLRDAAGYDVMRHISKQSCELIIKRAERFLNWVEGAIK
jgi:HEPN domain-containing protein